MKTLARFSSILVVAALAACSQAQQQQTQNSAQNASHAVSDAAQHGYRVASVAAKLAGVDVDATTDVHIAVSDGVVTLSGQAHTQAERDRYVAAAKSVDGVRSVVDDLTVNSGVTGVRESALDATLTARVAAAIAAQAGVNVFHVTPSASHGVVTLRGAVPSRSVRSTIVQAVRGVQGVKSVDDRITVAPSKG